LDGLPYLYTVMEYADQTLAELLLHRALTDDEAREMLLPTLDALAFLHGRNLVQGQLKPANILVVGDQLKLASDTIRRVSDGTMTPTVYDPPEARQGSSSTAGDIWALGVSLFEALARRPPPPGLGVGEPREAVLPGDFSPAFHDIVARCLSPSPQDRPDANELVAWAHGRSSAPRPAAATQPVAVVPPESSTTEPPPPHTAPEHLAPQPAAVLPPESSTTEPPPPPTAPERLAPQPAAVVPPESSTTQPPPPQTAPERPASTARRPAPSTKGYPKPRVLLTVILAAIAILALAWIGMRALRTHRAAVSPPPPVQDLGGSASQTPGEAAAAAAEVRSPSVASTSKPGRIDRSTSPSGLHEELPDVPWSARRTIRGHIRVWVRVMVDPDGSVFAAVADRSGPSGYFQRVAIEAAKKWTFPPVDTPSRRMMQVRFDFTRDGTTGRAVTLR
jgi:TonB family protein